jgi:hypothetical protein
LRNRSSPAWYDKRPGNPSATLKQIDIQSAAIADTQISEITSESKNAYVQALSKGASTTRLSPRRMPPQPPSSTA